LISDVVGDRLDAIASGPTVPDPTTYRDALDVLEGAELRDRVPLAVVEHLEAGALGEHDETPGEAHEAFERGSALVAADRTDAVDAAAKAARGVGFEPEVITTELDGEARDVGQAIAQRVLDRSTAEPADDEAACLLFAGETTVTIQGRGKGGRNQELALAAATALDEAPGTLERDVAMAAFATDGTDGPTRAAGAIVGPKTAERAREEGYDLRLQLRNNNSFQVLFAAGDLIVTGPTRTNVNDLICVFLD
jgi:hydroxypyruvate reductase